MLQLTVKHYFFSNLIAINELHFIVNITEFIFK